MEHGPVEFNDDTVGPSYVLDIAEHGPFTGVVLQKGIAAAYYQPGKYTVPLVLKLNGRTNLSGDQDPYAPMVCTVDEALSLGAKMVGYSLYLGSHYEGRMMAEFAQVVRDAHERKVRVIAWMHNRQARVAETQRDMLAYAGRVALELGADYVQLPFGDSVADYAWVVESAGRCKVLCPGGAYQDKENTLRLVKSVLQAGATGMTVGRRVWQDPDPLSVAQAIQAILWKGAA
jgi:class I fructose-bisphosphate aldolase